MEAWWAWNLEGRGTPPGPETPRLWVGTARCSRAVCWPTRERWTLDVCPHTSSSQWPSSRPIFGQSDQPHPAPATSALCRCPSPASPATIHGDVFFCPSPLPCLRAGLFSSAHASLPLSTRTHLHTSPCPPHLTTPPRRTASLCQGVCSPSVHPAHTTANFRVHHLTTSLQRLLSSLSFGTRGVVNPLAALSGAQTDRFRPPNFFFFFFSCFWPWRHA